MAEYSNLEKVRLEKLRKLQDLGIDPYPRKVDLSQSIQEAVNAFSAGENEEDPEPIQSTLAGRIRSIRTMGKSPLPILKTDRKDPAVFQIQ